MKNLFFISLLLFARLFLSAQVFDDFSDGDLSNSPTWLGDVANFAVVANQLQSNGSNAANQKIYISTSNQLIDSTEWSFLLDLKFNPTTTTLVRIYLVSNNADLKAALNGYYLQFGETNADSMDFFKQTGSVSTKLFTSKTNFSGNIKTKIKVVRTSTGLWTFYLDPNATGTFNLEGSISDLTHTQTSFAGFYCDYATASRFNLYNFDDFKINSIERDTIRPKIIKTTVVTNNQIALSFSEKISLKTAVTLSNYTIDQAIGNPNSVTFGTDSTNLTLNFTNSLQSGNSYGLTISGLSDQVGNLMSPQIIPFSYFIPGENSILINEIMADPTPSFGLPEFEYLELFNNSKFAINLAGWKLSKGTTDIAIPAYNLLPDSFLVLTSVSAAPQFSKFGAVLGVTSFPSLTNTGDQIILKNETGVIINQVNYAFDWYQDSDKQDGGFSLELINPAQLCIGKLNWRATANSAGGTPSKLNANYSTLKDTTAPTPVEVKVLSNSSLEITFSETVDGLSAKNFANYVISPLKEVLNLLTMSDNTYVMNISPLDSGITYTISINGLTDCLGNQQKTAKIFSFGLGKTPKFNDILITEIFADENPVIGLPEAEFVEIYNNTAQIIDLSGTTFTDGTTSVATFATGSIVLPNEYAIVCSSTKLNLFKPFGKVFALSSFPSLNSTGDKLVLKNKNNQLINEVAYLDDWYADPIKDDGGYSLEMINQTLTCKGGLNWAASTNSAGGTPGQQNSIYSNTPDLLAPKIKAVVLKKDTLFVSFNEPMEVSTLQDKNNYQFYQGLKLKSLFLPNNTDKSTIGILIDSLIEGKQYEIKLSNLKDCSGNNLKQDTTVTFGTGKAPNLFDVLITEIFADENPVVGLPESEYIEIYNNTSDIIDLQGCSLGDGTSTVAKFPTNSLLLPQEYAVVCSSTKGELFKSYGKVFALSSFPSLNSTGDKLVLKNKNNQLINEVAYLDDWYADPIKDDGGYSLEMINQTLTCKGGLNWAASTNSAGGTPGQQNSIYSNTPDLLAPKIKAVVLKKDTLFVSFNEPMEVSTLQDKNNYQFYQGLKLKSLFLPNNPDKSTIGILIDSLIEGKQYEIKLSNLKDCSGNNLKQDTTVTFGTGKAPNLFDVLITEIFADENPVVGLPESEYFEIYNNTSDIIDLQSCSIGDGTSTVAKFPTNSLLLPQEYAVVCSSTKGELFKSYGKVFALSSFPSLNSTGDLVYLKNPKQNFVHFVNYTDDWYANESKKEGGWSLEMVDITNPCGQEENWSASISASGGTPGQKNSIEASNPDITRPFITKIVAIDSVTLEISFNEILDSASVVAANYDFNPPLEITNKTVVAPKFNTLSLTIKNELEKKKVYSCITKSQADCVDNLNESQTINFVLPEKVEKGDIIINEILFNPRVGGNDFVEIYNCSNKYINLRNWSLSKLKSDGTLETIKIITLDNLIIEPNGYKILTDNINNVKQNYPKSVDQAFIELASMPTYTDEADSVILLSVDLEKIDSFYYNEDYHHPLLDDVEGVSLEKIAFKLPSLDKNSWHSAASTVGYATPGYLNSQATQLSEIRKNIELSTKIITPNGDGIKDFATIQYKFEKSGYVASIIVYDAKGREIKTIAKNELLGKEGIYNWDGSTNSGEKAAIGAYAAIIEIFNLSGQQDKWSESIAVYGD